LLSVLTVAPPARAGALRVFSLDQCADQYVIALAPRAAVVGVSPRVAAADSDLRAQSAGLPRRRATSESVLASGADLVIRYWGGDARLSRALARRGITVVDIQEATDFAGVRANIRAVAKAMGRSAQGEDLIAHMDAELARAAGAWDGRRVLYLTPGAYTTGPGELVDAMLRGAGLSNVVTAPGFAPAPLEHLVMYPPRGLVLGFFDTSAGAASWGPGRRQVLRSLADQRAIASLPAAVLGCPAWFAADGVQALAGKARAGRGAP